MHKVTQSDRATDWSLYCVLQITCTHNVVYTSIVVLNLLLPALKHADLLSGSTEQSVAEHCDRCWLEPNISPADSPARHQFTKFLTCQVIVDSICKQPLSL